MLNCIMHLYLICSYDLDCDVVKVLEFTPECVEAMVAKAKACKAAGHKPEALAILTSAQGLVPANRDITRAINK